jgi:maleate isomerase
LALIDPPWYSEELNAKGAAYFQNEGFDVVYSAPAAIGNGQRDVQPADVYDWVKAHVPDNAEAVFIAGNGFRAVGVIKALEEALGRPVLTANQVLLWQALQIANVKTTVESYGRIFEHAIKN